MRGWSIPAGKLFGVEIRIHLTFLFLLIFVWLTESVAQGKASPFRGLALAGIIFGCVILHEAGHALISLRSKTLPKAIVLLPIGGISMLDDSRDAKGPAWTREMQIALAGPVISLLCGAIAAGILSVALPEA